MEELVDKNKVVELGDRAKDDVTGFKGVVVAYAYHLHNCDRALLQSDGFHEGHPVKPMWFDVPSLVVLEKQVVNVIPVTHHEGEAELGDEVQDQISKFSGVMTALGLWITGCSRAGLSSKNLNPKSGEPLEDYWFPLTQLTVIKRAPGAETAQVATPKEQKKAKEQFVPSGWDQSKKPEEEMTAKHSDGKTYVFRGGKWVQKPGGPMKEPRSTSSMPGR